MHHSQRDRALRWRNVSQALQVSSLKLLSCSPEPAVSTILTAAAGPPTSFTTVQHARSLTHRARISGMSGALNLGVTESCLCASHPLEFSVSCEKAPQVIPRFAGITWDDPVDRDREAQRFMLRDFSYYRYPFIGIYWIIVDIIDVQKRWCLVALRRWLL